MTDENEVNEALENFLEERSKIPIPTGEVARLKLIAKELALGVHKNLWDPRLILRRFVAGASAVTAEPATYFERRWASYDLDNIAHLLAGHEYMKPTDSGNGLTLSVKAYELLDETQSYNVFISYRRHDSSALALLVLARLKEHDLVPFVDMALEAGGNWHADLEERIKDNDYFIILLGKDTLSSPMTVKEICWAIDYERTIIPIWHNQFGQETGFDLNQHIDEVAEKWKDDRLLARKTEVHDVIQQTQAIIVQSESASGYNTAIVELLNRFGITP